MFLNKLERLFLIGLSSLVCLMFVGKAFYDRNMRMFLIKLECLFLGRPFQPRLMFTGNAFYDRNITNFLN